MHPHIHAKTNADKAAIIMGNSGEIITYGQLDRRSNRAAHLYRSIGLNIGDIIAICMENVAEFFDLVWGAQRAGIIFVVVSNRLTASEINYILKDSGAKAVFCGASLGDKLLNQISQCEHQYILGADKSGWENLHRAMQAQPITPIKDERAGTDMLYSSGTTGKPKGVRFPLPEDENIAAGNALVMLAGGVFGLNADSIYLSPAPLYHAAPLRWCMTVHRLGGTVVVMNKFDPEKALELIQKYHINASQWVPTHFVRMSKLPPETRAKYDVSSLKCAIHAAAPCPMPIKEMMINWFGPVLMEYYAGTEGNGFTYINSADWMTHKGSVGRALLGIIRICDDEGNELPAGEIGHIYFEGGPQFTYHNDKEKTADSHNQQGWSTLGDVGYVDEDGFLYLTDRKSFMIISGGVNVYPQEIENLLITHPKIADAAVIGAPDDDLGEKVVAVVQPMNMADANEAFTAEVYAFLRQTLSGVKIPKSIDYRAELPRHPTGKLYKRLLRDEYWAARS
ncbi:acyl-CoA synthetase [Sphingorhabdus lutea]|uniref:Acyl-CoA synthetase n=1 Tax=Sphingorhabdus lutea TaxID=1913578 RepID=A0A1L3J9M4_9SPHN|nr:acyl-CoA synthetase [Sphingorhabdus lutea]APG61836.1 acyl-CoA synthetase [Sphingorhabdus lutea]